LGDTDNFINRVLEIDMIPDLPDFIGAEEWDGFVDMRAAQKKPLTDRAKKIFLKKLAAWHQEGYDCNKILDNSTESSWGKLYPKPEFLRGGEKAQLEAKIYKITDRSWAK